MASGKLNVGYQATKFDKIVMGVIHGGVITIASNLVLGFLMLLFILVIAFLNAHFPVALVHLEKILIQVFESGFLTVIYWGQALVVVLLAVRENDPDLKWYLSGLTSLLLLILFVHF